MTRRSLPGAALAVACAAAITGSTSARGQELPATGAERVQYERHTSHDELMSFLYDVQSRSDRMLIRHLATTADGRTMPLVILGDPRLSYVVFDVEQRVRCRAGGIRPRYQPPADEGYEGDTGQCDGAAHRGAVPADLRPWP